MKGEIIPEKWLFEFSIYHTLSHMPPSAFFRHMSLDLSSPDMLITS